MAYLENPNVTVLNSKAITHLFSHIRHKDTDLKNYIYYSNRLMRILAEEAIAELPSTPAEIPTPVGTYSGVSLDENNCIAVSIIRAGDSLLDAVRNVLPAIPVGKILIQRNEESQEKEPILYYTKLPSNDLNKKSVLLVDPMLASGGSAICAIKCLIDSGADESKIIFVNVISCPFGLEKLTAAYPKIKIVTAAVDPILNENKYIVPGLGDWGDRFYGTM